MDLTYKQRLFVSAYLGKANGNATEAARIAGYSEHEVTGHRTLKNAKVRAAIDARLDQAAMSADEVLARLSEIASGSLEHFIKIDGQGWTISLPRAKKRGKLRLLKKLKSGEHGPEIEIHDPMGALDKLAKVHGLYKIPPGASTLDYSDATDDDTGDPVKTS